MVKNVQKDNCERSALPRMLKKSPKNSGGGDIPCLLVTWKKNQEKKTRELRGQLFSQIIGMLFNFSVGENEIELRVFAQC